MKHLVDIHVVLATPDDFEQWEDDAELACEKFNTILHVLYHRVSEDIDTQSLEKMIQHVWENWSQDQNILDIEEDDLCDWVDQLLATWDDE